MAGEVFILGAGGSGGSGGILTVTAPAGVSVSVSKDGKMKRKTANADGLAVFKGLATGTWTLTITDGSQTSTKSVVITADYSVVIAFFSATINVTYPSGSACTCTDGTTTLTAPDTSGTWACVVPNSGTWTVNITKGTSVASTKVSITADGQSKSVNLSYGTLYEPGNQHTDKTGGWEGSATIDSNGIVKMVGSGGLGDTFYTKKLISKGTAKNLYINVPSLSRSDGSIQACLSCVNSSPQDAGASGNVYSWIEITAKGKHNISLTGINNPFYVYMYVAESITATIDQIGLE